MRLQPQLMLAFCFVIKLTRLIKSHSHITINNLLFISKISTTLKDHRLAQISKKNEMIITHNSTFHT
jgi:hypothetical protein